MEELPWDTVIDPDLAPYGKTQDFRMAHNSKAPGATNFLEPILEGSYLGWSARFAQWPVGASSEATIARQIEHAMVCHVPTDATHLTPILTLPRRALATCRVQDPDAQVRAFTASGPLEVALLEALAKWEQEKHQVRTNPRPRHWTSEDTLYMQNGSCGFHTCPHGHTYHNNNFALRCRGHEIEYGCIFTTASGGHGDCEGMPWTPIGCLPANMWEVPREEYDHCDATGKPRVRPLPLEFSSLVEGSEMGLGKTHAMTKMIEALHIDDPCLIILHHVTMCETAAERLEDLGFVLYSEVTGPIEDPRVIVCINSLWRVQRSDFALVVIDETPEVVASLSTLRPRSGGVGKWAVWDKLCDVVAHAQRRLFLSAQSDRLVDEFTKAVGCENVTWQMSSAKPLAGVMHKIVHCADSGASSLRHNNRKSLIINGPRYSGLLFGIIFFYHLALGGG